MGEKNNLRWNCYGEVDKQSFQFDFCIYFFVLFYFCFFVFFLEKKNKKIKMAKKKWTFHTTHHIPCPFFWEPSRIKWPIISVVCCFFVVTPSSSSCAANHAMALS